MTTWRLLAPLRPGDRVRIVAPGGAVERERLEEGLVALRAMGLEPVFDEQVFARQRYFAGDDSVRVGQLQAALSDPSVRAIWAARGGYGTARLLPTVPADAVARAGKWLIGFSDISALHCLWAQAGFASVHAVTISTLASWSPDALRTLSQCLFAPQPQLLRGHPSGGAEQPIRGRLMGGNLTVLASLAGTGFLPSWQDSIVFLEDVAEVPYRLDRCITQLRLAGAFAGVRGVALGQLTRCGEHPAGDPRPHPAIEAIVAALAPLGVPVLTGLPVGHEATSYPMLLGVWATMDVAAGTLRVDPVV